MATSSSRQTDSDTRRHIVITGASSGIGRAIALHYAAPDVILTLIGRDPDRTRDIAAICRSKGADVRSELVDVTDAQTMSHVLASCENADPIDTIIAAAGIGGHHAIAAETGEHGNAATQLFATNMLGVINTITPVLPAMVKRGRGRIAVIASLAGWLGMPQGPAYSASKAASEIYADGLRRLLAPQGIRVTTVLPGFVDTPMSQSLGGPQPWRFSAEHAANRIVRSIEAGHRRCIFPWQMRAAILCVKILPMPLLDWFLSKTYKQLAHLYRSQ